MMYRAAWGVVAAVIVVASPARAQEHEHHHGDHVDRRVGDEPALPTVVELDRRRNASGTAWQPELVPHEGWHGRAAGFDLMFHGLLFAGYAATGGARGAKAATSIGWIMGMADRSWSSGRIGARLMLSHEPATVRHGGYPLLLQTGETWQGVPIHDRQHPHDLFMEVALLATQEVAPGLAVQLYAAPAGEPALGPVAFPHRASAFADPLATLSHHWQDSTHISFGVLTVAFITRYAKLDASWFNGTEPDENRWDFDLARPNALSVRLSVNPTASLSAQVSYGNLPSHEHHAHAPGTAAHGHDDHAAHMHKITASVAHHIPLGDGALSSIFIYGRNQGHERGANAFVAESTLGFGRNLTFARVELVEKTASELVLPAALAERSYSLLALAAGYVRNLGTYAGLVPGIGVRGAIHLLPGGLEPFYGSRTPVGGMVYLRVATTGGGAHEHHRM